MKRTNLILGKTDTGKTRGILFNEVNKYIENNENLLFLDTKEEYYQTYYEKLQNEKYNIFTLNLSDTTKSNSWNPLTLPYKIYKSGRIDDAISLINDLTLTICREENDVDSFWEKSAANYLASLILILFKNATEEEINIGSIGMLITDSEKKNDDTIMIKKYLEGLNPLDPIYIMAAGTVFSPYETRASIASVLRQKINNFLVRENLLNILSGDEIELLNLKDKTAIFIITQDETTNSLANILINQVVFATKKKTGFTFILDNLETLKPLLGFKTLIENAKTYNFNINVAFKTLENFELQYGKHLQENFKNITTNLEENMNELNFIELGNYNKYIESKKNKVKYFELEKILSNLK